MVVRVPQAPHFQLRVVCALIASLLLVFAHAASAQQAAPVSSVRLYVIDLGGRPPGPRESVYPAYLIVHPKGTLLWEAGSLPEAYVGTDRSREDLRDALRTIVQQKTLRSQLAEIGYTPKQITYFALSHYHDDHTGTANDWAGSTWLVQRAERDAMFADPPPAIGDIRTTGALKNAKTIIIENRDHDVFGDGSVVLKFTPGHTPGSQILFVKLAKTGPVLLTGDTYSLVAQRVAPYDAGVVATSPAKEQQIASRTAMEAFAKQTGATMWVHHDVPSSKALKKSPQYYE